MSVAADIRTAVKAAVDGLTLTGTPGTAVRKRPGYKSGDAAAGMVVVSGIEMGADPLTGEDDAATAGRYGIAVTAIRPNAGSEASDGTVEGWVEEVRLALDVPNPLPTVPEVADVRVRERPWFNPAGLDKNFDYAQLALVFETIEARP